VIFACVGDDTVRGTNQFKLGEALELRSQRHALDDQGLGSGPSGKRQDAQLLDDVRLGRTKYGVLVALMRDDTGQRAGGLGNGGYTVGAQAGGDQSRHRGFAAGAVDVNPNWNGADVAAVQTEFQHAEQSGNCNHDAQGDE
jgi:hypothetical protein